jgi:hypothetical protein
MKRNVQISNTVHVLIAKKNRKKNTKKSKSRVTKIEIGKKTKVKDFALVPLFSKLNLNLNTSRDEMAQYLFVIKL